MPTFNRHTLLFSLNSFAASMLALYIALAVGLPRPYWAMTTAYIVSQPLSGAVRSKAIYRVVGTIIGGLATVALVPNLVNAPPLLCLALALWVGGCLTISLLDRTPRSYLVVLAGYTAALIGFPVVGQPDTVFDVAVARVVEIGLGIVCASLTHSLVFPRPVGRVLQHRLGEWLQEADRWVLDVLSAAPGAVSARDRTALAAATTEIQMLASHLPFDTSRLRDTRAAVRAVQERMLMLIPLISGLADRIAALEAEGGLDAETAAIREAAADWIRAGAALETRADLLDRVGRHQAALPLNDWRGLLTESLMLRLRETATALSEAHALRGHLRWPDAPLAPETAQAVAQAGRRPLHVDLPLAVLSGATAVIAILIACVLWIGLGWNDGVTAAMMTAVFCCLFATLDDPAPQIAKFAIFAFLSLPLAGLYLFAVLPAVSGFAMLTVALAPILIFIGLYIAEPKTTGEGLAIVMTFLNALALQESFHPDLPSFVNANLAQFVGAFIAIVVTRTLRSMSAEASARRLLRRTWLGLAAMARAGAGPEHGAFASLLVDRLALLSPKLAGAGEVRDELGDAALADLRVAMNLVSVQTSRPQVGGPVGRRLDAVSRGLAAHFSRLARDGRQPPGP
ncbi:MAG TPA: FUSC family protein, partial [Phenylobacterium sp.]|uniref:FUSC family protein n=1 Tax=Phenylobacterium sp. TaxID=1871053 RepID=UPI002B46D6AE